MTFKTCLVVFLVFVPTIFFFLKCSDKSAFQCFFFVVKGRSTLEHMCHSVPSPAGEGAMQAAVHRCVGIDA